MGFRADAVTLLQAQVRLRKPLGYILLNYVTRDLFAGFRADVISLFQAHVRSRMLLNNIMLCCIIRELIIDDPHAVSIHSVTNHRHETSLGFCACVVIALMQA